MKGWTSDTASERQTLCPLRKPQRYKRPHAQALVASLSRMTRRDRIQQGATQKGSGVVYGGVRQGEVAQIGEPPARAGTGSLVESRGKLDSKDRFPGAVRLVRASKMAGTNRLSRWA